MSSPPPFEPSPSVRTACPFAAAAWSWLKELYSAQIADFQPCEPHYCLSLRDAAAGVEMDVRLNLACARLQFCSAVAILPSGAEHKALAFLAANRCLDCPMGCLCFAYAPERREIFVQGSAALTQFDGAASLDAFLHEALDRMADIKAKAAELRSQEPPPPAF